MILSSGFLTYSQERSTENQEDEVDEIIDSFLEEDVVDELIQDLNAFKFLYVSVNYNRDTYFSGRDIGIDQHNIRPQITYMDAKGFMLSVSGMYYSKFVPKWDYSAATIGYTRSFGNNKLFRLFGSGSRYFYSKEVDNPFHYAISFGSGVKNKKRTLSTQLSGTYLFGDDQSFQLTSSSHASFILFKKKTNTLKLKPELNIIAAQQTFELAQVQFENGERVVGYLENDVFGLINTQINIPLELSMQSFDFELGYNLNIPTANSTESNLKVTGYFNFSVAYLFDL